MMLYHASANTSRAICCRRAWALAVIGVTEAALHTWSSPQRRASIAIRRRWYGEDAKMIRPSARSAAPRTVARVLLPALSQNMAVAGTPHARSVRAMTCASNRFSEAPPLQTILSAAPRSYSDLACHRRDANSRQRTGGQNLSAEDNDHITVDRAGRGARPRDPSPDRGDGPGHYSKKNARSAHHGPDYG